MRFTRQDFKYPSMEHYFSLSKDTSPGTDRFDTLLDYMKECTKIKYKLAKTWLLKIDAVRSLVLDELVLDFSDAYGADDEFLSRCFAGIEITFSDGNPANIIFSGTDDRCISERYLRNSRC